MKVIRNNIIPFKGFVAINLLGIVFVRKDYKFKHSIRHKAYRNISFEREAYANQHKWDYNKGRKRYAFLKYIKEYEQRNEV